MKIGINVKNTRSFGSLYRLSKYKDYYGKERYTQNSTAGRDDLNYHVFAQIIKSNFDSFEKINIMPMNGSDGTEGYLIANSIIDIFGEKEAKRRVFPIQITDVDSFIIENFGKKSVVAFHDTDRKLFGNNFNSFFEQIPNAELPKLPYAYDEAKAYRLKEKFKKIFRFETMDFQERIEKLQDKGNSVVIIRNCLADAFGDDEIKNILIKLREKLKSPSLFILGGYDRWMMPKIVSFLNNIGFEEIEQNIFRLKKNV